MRVALIILGTLLLTACGGREDPQLLNPRQPAGQGPDEFAILPTKPLTIPEDLAALPAPTPGGTNLTDPTPEADAIVALGGRPGSSVGAGDGALLRHAGRFGTVPSIRATLAAEDLAFRRANDSRLLERLFNTSVYYRVYEPQMLDTYAELERMRRAGIRTPSAPPPRDE